MQVVPMLHMS